MGIRMKYFPRDTGVNHEQIAAMNHTSEFIIQKAKLKNLNAITCMGSLGLNSQKSMQFFKETNEASE
jgi:hypothetical protein